jgi:hypothetical protein
MSTIASRTLRGLIAVCAVAAAGLWFASAASALPVAASDGQGVAPEALVYGAPGGDSSSALPIGNGELAASLWVDATGAVQVLLARGDAFSEASRLLKVAAFALELSPPPRLDAGYRETLDVARGEWRLVFEGGELVVFVEHDRPVLRVLGRFDEPREVRLRDAGWRRAERRLEGGELASSWTMRDAPAGVFVLESADGVRSGAGWFATYHHNATSVVPLTLAHQGLESLSETFGDPLLGRTFGALAFVDGARADGERALVTERLRELDAAIAAPAACLPPFPNIDPAEPWTWAEEPAATVERFLAGALELARTRPAAERARSANGAQWQAFWARSWIVVRGDAPGFAVPASSHALRVGRDSAGGNPWRGEIHGALALGGARDGAGVAELARAPRPHGELPSGASPPELPLPDLANGFTLAAWVRRDPGQGDARIFDRLTAGGTDGFLFDTHPGSSLRLIVGERTLVAREALPDDGTCHHVAATYDTASGTLAVYCDGALVGTSGPAPGGDTASPITRGYALQRYATRCVGRGEFPIKFNGSLLTVEPRAAGGQPYDADWRRWGDCYWWQNTRLPYHAMLAAGDFELLAPLFDFHARIAPACAARAELYHGVRGLYFPETVTMFGTYSNGDYGWQREGHAANEVLCPWWQWCWNQGLELVALMLDRQAYAPDLAFARDELVPLAREVLLYFDSRFARDENGRLVITPTQALETHWHGVVNDLPCVAGLHDVLERLAQLPSAAASDLDRGLWARLAGALPPLPVREVDGVQLLAPAERYDASRQNVETPELYALFPFRRFAIGRPGIELAAEAHARRHDRQSHGWTQDGTFAARLGLVEEARANLVARAANSHPAYRFPATWGPNFDWLPDQCHGANLMLLAQEMLLQCDGRRILLFPAWPKDWDADFKLHAAHGTVVRARLEDGEIVELTVEPPSRLADVEVLLR